MPLTLKNYAKELPKELLQLSEKNEVRECDEVEKGHFVAFVDEGSNSFDVSLTILPNNQIGQSSCDCENKIAFCRHKVALLLHITKDKKVKEVVKLKKKDGGAETLLEQVELSELKDWVKSLVSKNKDIELAFVHYFSVKKQQYTIEEVGKLIKDAIKATGCSKKNIDATLIKKLVELWAEVLQPVILNYQANVMDEKAFQSFHAMIENCLQFQAGINSSSTRIAKYIEDVLQKSEAAINGLLNDEAWYRATSLFVDHVPDRINSVRPHYLLHLQNIIGASSSERKDKLIDQLANQFKKSTPEKLVNGSIYTKTIFGIIESGNLLPQYYKIFKPLHFENDFNQKLITLLIENKQLELAKNYCEEQIKRNYREEYSIPYLKLLKEIYTVEKDEIKLAGVLTVLFPYSFNFDEYLFIIERLQPEEKKKWQTKVLSRARNASHSSNTMPLEFCFKLMEHEENYRKMIDYIDSYCPFDIILKYFAPMFSADKARLLSAIIQKSDSGWSYSDGFEKEKASFAGLFVLLKKHYTAEYLKMVLDRFAKDKYYSYRSNHLVVYMKEQLDMR